jgi:hypothetical protein
MTPEETVTRYCAAWDEPDALRRRAILQEVWAADGRYTDPTVDLEGVDALGAHIGRVQETYPGSHIERLSAVDLHHDVLRFTWRRMLADGQPRPDGVDFGVLAPDGKLALIVGFFGPVKAAS